MKHLKLRVFEDYTARTPILLPFLLLLSMFLLGIINSKAALTLITSTGSGSWETNSTWSLNRQPTNGDSIVIQSSHTITINSQENYQGNSTIMKVMVKGNLDFQNGKKLKLPNNSALYVFNGGSINGGGGGGNSNVIDIGTTTVWNSGMGTFSGPGCLPSSLAGCSSALPVTLASFNVHVFSASDLAIQWSTATENNTAWFEIQKSTDGRIYETIGKVNAQGNSNTLTHYEYRDAVTSSGTTYYRLATVDFDGYREFSNILTYGSTSVASMQVYPNPLEGQSLVLSFRIPHQQGGLNARIMDMSGKQVFFSNLNNEGDESLQMTTLNLG